MVVADYDGAASDAVEDLPDERLPTFPLDIVLETRWL
jgi:hypothetical protein